jgi:hypothetical protein
MRPIFWLPVSFRKTVPSAHVLPPFVHCLELGGDLQDDSTLCVGTCGTCLRSSRDKDFAFAGSLADAVPGQWSYNIGPCRGIELGDHLWLSRYLLLRLSEQFKVTNSAASRTSLGTVDLDFHEIALCPILAAYLLDNVLLNTCLTHTTASDAFG